MQVRTNTMPARAIKRVSMRSDLIGRVRVRVSLGMRVQPICMRMRVQPKYMLLSGGAHSSSEHGQHVRGQVMRVRRLGHVIS